MQLIVYSLNNPYTSEKRKYESNDKYKNKSQHTQKTGTAEFPLFCVSMAGHKGRNNPMFWNACSLLQDLGGLIPPDRADSRRQSSCRNPAQLHVLHRGAVRWICEPDAWEPSQHRDFVRVWTKTCSESASRREVSVSPPPLPLWETRLSNADIRMPKSTHTKDLF